MPAPISVIIPTLNSAKSLPATLMSLMEGLDAGLIRDVVISDGGSTDEITQLADDWGATSVQGPASRGGQLGRGAKAAKGTHFLFLHADTVLESGWSDEIADLRGSSPLVFSLSFRAKGIGAKWVAGWANWRTDVLRLPYGDQGLLISRDAYDGVGGFPDQPLMEDVALIRKLPIPARRLKSRAFTGAEKYQREGWFFRGAKNLWTLVRYFAGASPSRLARSYASSKSEN